MTVVTVNPLHRFYVLTIARFVVPIVFVGLIPAGLAIWQNSKRIDDINRARAEGRIRFAEADRRSCLFMNQITYRDRQTIKFTPEKEAAARDLYERLGFTSAQVEALLINQLMAADRELARRTFLPCRRLPSQPGRR